VTAERQTWANPLPELQIVDKTDPLKNKPYGTFQPQIRYTAVGDQDDQSSHHRPSAEQLTSNATDTERTEDLDADAVTADDEAAERRGESDAVTGSDS